MENILNNINIVNLHINLWQGDKVLKPEDLAANGIDVSKLPPGKLASLGCKRTIGKEATSIFTSLKREAQVACSKYGVKFGDSAYAIPKDKTEEVCAKLSEIKNLFANEKTIFLTYYDDFTNTWIESNPPEWREIIRKSLDPESKVESRLSFNFSAFKINTPDDNVQNGLDEQAGGLYSQLCKEIRSMAGIALKTSFAGKSGVGRRALRPIESIAIKLQSMSFLDTNIPDLVKEIGSTIIDAERAINGQQHKLLTGTVFNQTVGMLTKLSHMGEKTVYEEATSEEIEEEIIIVAGIEKPQWDF